MVFNFQTHFRSSKRDEHINKIGDEASRYSSALTASHRGGWLAGLRQHARQQGGRADSSCSRERVETGGSRPETEPSALVAGIALHDSAPDQSEQSPHQFAVLLSQRIEDREMVGPVDRQQMPRQSALDPRLGVTDRLAA